MLTHVYLTTDNGLSRAIATEHAALHPPVPGPFLDVETREALEPGELLHATFVNLEDGTEVTLECRVEWAVPPRPVLVLARLRVLAVCVEDGLGVLIPCERTMH